MLFGFTRLLMIAVPGYISRSVAGSYDNEGIAIFALMFTYYLWVCVFITYVSTFKHCVRLQWCVLMFSDKIRKNRRNHLVNLNSIIISLYGQYFLHFIKT